MSSTFLSNKQRIALSQPAAGRSAGFTLVELLVVIAIIGVLVAMTLPAINASRETARRSQCLKNLSELSIALQNYEMAHEVFPPGTIDAQGPIHSVAKGDHRNWILHLLPYMEETVVYRHIDQAAGVYASKNEPARNTVIEILQCPSDASGPCTRQPAIMRRCIMTWKRRSTSTTIHGSFFLNSKLRHDDFTDGLSHDVVPGRETMRR